MKCVKVELKNAETVKKELIRLKLIDSNYRPIRKNEYMYYPIKKNNTFLDYKIVNKKLEKKQEKSIKELLIKELTKKEKKLLNRAFDTIGDIAIIEIEEELLSKKEIIANSILKLHKNIKTVVRKIGGHEGEYRIQQYEYLAGEKKTETVHKENGIIIKLDIAKTYFTPRWASERLRIAKQVKENEKVLVMFSGVGIFGLIIAKHSKAKEIICIEINSDACKYSDENIKLNKIKNMKNYCGDVRAVIPEIRLLGFDRVIMPLPKTAVEYLDLATKVTKTDGIIHLYLFSTEEDIKNKINEIEKNYKVELINIIKTGQQSPKVWRYCMDFRNY